MDYNITLYSTALFSTWINVEELSLLIDAGDGVTAGLLQKSRKIKHVFITHPDRDHLAGLLQFNQLNSREGFPKIYYPSDSGSFPAMRDFQVRFDPHVSGTIWQGLQDGSHTPIKSGYEIEAIRNEHIQAPKGVHKSLSYKLHQVKQKLKPEFASLTGLEIQQLVKEKGRDHISETVKSNKISFSGDTPVDNYERWDHSEILIHEATFIREETKQSDIVKWQKHSTLEQVIRMVSEIDIKTLILNHFSSRYSKDEILDSIRLFCKQYKIDIPVYAVYPGEIQRDILNSIPVNQ